MYKMIFYLLLLVTVSQTACTRKEPPPVADGPEVGEFQVDVTFLADPPKRGRNEVQVQITPRRDRISKGSKEPIRPDQISVVAIMPAMATMSEMRSEAEMVWQDNGSMKGTILLGMGGNWFLDIEFTPPGKPAHQARFKLTTDVPGMTLLQSSIEGVADRQSDVTAVEPKKEMTRSGEVVIPKAKQQLIGVKTDIVKRRLLIKTVRTQGRVTYDERKRSEIALKFSGFIGKVFVDFVGKPIEKNQPLFTIYSPELAVALEEYITLTQSTRTTQAPSVLFSLIKTARQKLLLWDLTDKQIDSIVQVGEIPQYIPILSPASGIVVEKQVVQGSPVMAGQILYRLANLSTVWIEASIYESEFSLMQTGLPVQVQPISFPNKRFDGSVSFIYPMLDSESRSGRVRIDVSNPNNQLLPEMSVNLTAQLSLGEPVTLSKEAIIYSGENQIVFVDLGEGRFMPRRVKIGQKGDQFYEVIEGVSEGEHVVTGGNFMLAAESRLTSGLAIFETYPMKGTP
jgi:Cu(I)/Ag(I) efflux system membrane fusion protein